MRLVVQAHQWREILTFCADRCNSFVVVSTARALLLRLELDEPDN